MISHPPSPPSPIILLRSTSATIPKVCNGIVGGKRRCPPRKSDTAVNRSDETGVIVRPFLRPPPPPPAAAGGFAIAGVGAAVDFHPKT